ncbi:MAG: hypothetical protein ACTS45_01035 [Candidatus Hodgkinia cicadicola]
MNILIYQIYFTLVSLIVPPNVSLIQFFASSVVMTFRFFSKTILSN